jgi:trehalose-phosphatase
MLKPLWLHLDDIADRIRTTRRLYVGADFDGTLTEIVAHPNIAQLSGRSRAVLAEIPRLEGAHLGIVSGRPLDELRERLEIDRVFLSGIAGLETYDEGGERHLHVREAEALPEALRDSLKEWCGRFEGAWFEDKGPAFATHYRAVADRFQPAFCSGVRRRFAAVRGRARLSHGKKVFEVLPGLERDKAAALVEWFGDPAGALVFYFGDDANDEPVYPKLRETGGITVAIGRWASRAEYGLPSPLQVTWFLEWLVREWRESRAEAAKQPEPRAEQEREPEPMQTQEMHPEFTSTANGYENRSAS